MFVPTPDENQKLVLLESGQVEVTDTVPLPRVQEVERNNRLVVYGIEPGVSPSSYYHADARRPAAARQPQGAPGHQLRHRSQGPQPGDVRQGHDQVERDPARSTGPSTRSRYRSTIATSARAKKLMAESGVGNVNLQLKHLTSRAEFFTLGQIVQSNLAEIGIRIELIPQQIGIWVNQVLVQRDFQLGLTGVDSALRSRRDAGRAVLGATRERSRDRVEARAIRAADGSGQSLREAG